MSISKSYNFSQVLYIGPQYKNHRGGIGAVLETYSKHIEGFKFIATYDGRYGRLKNNLLFVGSLVRLVFVLLFDQKIKIVHINGASRGSFYRKYIVFYISKYIFIKKVVYHLHGGGFHEFFETSGAFLKNKIGDLVNNADLFICLSESWYRYLVRSFNLQNIVVLNNPINNVANNKGLFAKSSISNFLFLGYIVDAKGIFDLLSVITKNKINWDGKLKLTIGGNEPVKRIEKLIKQNGLDNLVDYVGWASGSLKDKLLQSCDILVLPSYKEGLPISILEAMVNGKAILSTTVGGIPEIVKNGENGFLITPGDLNAIESKINYLIGHPKIVKEMGEDSLRKVQPYLVESVLQKMEFEYSKLI